MDIDIDIKDRNDLLEKLNNYVNASVIKKNKISRHPSGIYLQDIPVDPETDLSSISYEKAENFGFYKIDILNNYSYFDIETPEELDYLLNMTPDWNLLRKKDIVEQLPHIHNYYDDLQKFQVGNIHELAAFLAIIRPGKSYLRKKSKDMVMKEVWKKPKNNENAYFFKKSHAYAYALMIIVKMNLLSLKEKN